MSTCNKCKRENSFSSVRKHTEWKKWFAWRPVKVENKWTWLRYIESQYWWTEDRINGHAPEISLPGYRKFRRIKNEKVKS